MNELPELILAELFSFLNLREKRLLRAVNRSWRYVIDTYSLTERLCVCHPTSQFIDLFDPQDVLLVERAGHYAAIFSAQLKRQLKELHVFPSPITADLQAELSRRPADFAGLKVLKIDGLQLEADEFRLDLPTLHTLSLKGFEFGQGVVLSCPGLQRLTIHNFVNQQIVIEHEESIRFLECQFLNDCFTGLVNVEHLIALKIEIAILELFLSSKLEFRKLARLEVYPSWEAFDLLMQTLKDKKHLFAANASIYINGFACPEDDPVNVRLFDAYRARYQASEKSLFLGTKQDEEIVRNYSKLVRNRISIGFRTQINYSSLSGKFSGRIPGSFFAIFRNIQEVELHRKVATKELLQFLHNAKTVRWLAIFECELDQALYDGLPSVQSISDLKISEKRERIDFEFLGNLKRLSSFRLHSFGLPLKAVCRAFEKCKYLDRFYFEPNTGRKNAIQLSRTREKDRFSLRLFNDDRPRKPTNLGTICQLLSQNGQLNIVK